jgi:hypothetical protein
MATIGVLAFFSLAARFEGNPFLIIVLSIFGATVIYYGICLLFGTQELRELAVPDFIKRAIFHKDETDE